MAGRGMLFAEGPNACPFVALESDRDRRAAEPDPRHRCYAEPAPAPRALAHQREFCLSPDFSGCPIFQDWAVRASARPVPLRPPASDFGEAPGAPSGPQQLPAFATLEDPAAASEQPDPAAQSSAQSGIPEFPPPLREPDAAAGGRSLDPDPIERVPSLPLEPSAEADEVPAEVPDESQPVYTEPDHRRPKPRPRWTEDWPPSAPSAAGAAGGAWLGTGPPSGRPEAAADRPSPASTPSTPASSLAPAPPPAPPSRPQSQIEVGRPLRFSRGRRERASPRDEWSAQRADLIPAWERERYAAYPGWRARVGMGDSDALLGRLTRILGIIAVVAVIIALLLLAPGFFAGGPGGSPSPSTSPSPSGPTASPSPSVTPEPTLSFGTYVVQPGDSLSAIAVELGLLPCQIQAANPEITDPNHIFIGQVLRIPPDDFALDCQATPAASP